MDEIKAMLDALRVMRNVFDGYNEDPRFVGGAIEWQHSFQVKEDHTEEVEAYITERHLTAWQVTYDHVTKELHVFARIRALKRSPPAPRSAPACTRA
jgi:hypothetical protein